MKTSSRIYGFDALRATAMWLGVILHSIIFFKQNPAENWPHDQYLFSAGLEWLYEFIHSFRMPLFFLVAGYFSKVVIEKSGLNIFVNQRVQRILIPFIIGLIVIVPLTLLPFHFHRYYYDEGNTFNTAVSLSLSQIIRWNGMAHLWFLYYLLIFYSISALMIAGSRKLANKPIVLKTTQVSRPGILIMPLISIIAIWAILTYFKSASPPVYTGIRISEFYLGYYGFFYLSGWIICSRSFNISGLFPVSWTLFLIGLILSIVLFYFANRGVNPYWIYLLHSVERVFLIYGMIGLFIRYFNRQSFFWTYFSASSYWVYLIHLMIVVYTQAILQPVTINPWVKLILIIFVTFIVSVVSFHLFVSNTVIGKTLNGKKIRQQKTLLNIFTVGKKKPEGPITN